MKFLLIIFFFLSILSHAEDSAEYKIKKGKLHKGGDVKVDILPDPDTFKVRMSYDVEKKDFVPVPSKVLKGKTVMEFPEKFQTEEGYRELEHKKVMDIPKARLKFVRRINHLGGKRSYVLKVLPSNNKTVIDITYNPDLPSVGWSKVVITFISSIPLLDGYEIEAVVKE